jgi:hypothetical protein
MDVTIKNGKRFSTYDGFIKPIKDKRKNLSIYLYSRAIKVTILLLLDCNTVKGNVEPTKYLDSPRPDKNSIRRHIQATRNHKIRTSKEGNHLKCWSNRFPEITITLWDRSQGRSTFYRGTLRHFS